MRDDFKITVRPAGDHFTVIDGHARLAVLDARTPNHMYNVMTDHGMLHRRWLKIENRSDFEILADGILRSRHAPTERAKELDNLFRFVMPQEYDFNEVRILGTLEWLRRNGPAPMYVWFVEKIKAFGYGHLLS